MTELLLGVVTESMQREGAQHSCGCIPSSPDYATYGAASDSPQLRETRLQDLKGDTWTREAGKRDRGQVGEKLTSGRMQLN